MSKKREEIEDAAMDAIQRTGLGHVSFRHIGEAVGVKSSSVHYHFPEKGDLVIALIEKYTLAFRERLEAIDKRSKSQKEGGPTTEKQLKAFVKIFEDVIKAGKFCLCGMMAAEVASLDDEAKALLALYFKEAEDWLTNVFATSDDLTIDLEPRTLARIFISGLEGAILIDRATGGTNRLRSFNDLIRSLVLVKAS